MPILSLNIHSYYYNCRMILSRIWQKVINGLFRFIIAFEIFDQLAVTVDLFSQLFYTRMAFSVTLAAEEVKEVEKWRK
jgi:hypothetical protein